VGGVYFNGRSLPKKTSPDGKIITVAVPGDNEFGSWYFELKYNGQMIQSQNRLEVIPSFGSQAQGDGEKNPIIPPIYKQGIIIPTPPADRTPPPPEGRGENIPPIYKQGIIVPSIPPIQKQGITIESMSALEQDTDRPGMNLEGGYTLSSADPQICSNDCAKNPDCRAFTYVKPGFREPNSPPECWLKKGVPERVLQKYCISGVKVGVKDDWINIPGLVLYLYHNKNQVAPNLGPVRSDLYFFGAFDQGASEGEGYCWWQIPDNPNANPDDWSNKLPSGLVLALLFYEQQAGDGRITSFGVSPDQKGSYAYGFLSKQIGMDYKWTTYPHHQLPSGVYWFETYNPDFGNWDAAEKNLPKGAVLCLKHVNLQPDKTITWRGQQYDPVKSYREISFQQSS
jgi:hypothetical protein